MTTPRTSWAGARLPVVLSLASAALAGCHGAGRTEAELDPVIAPWSCSPRVELSSLWAHLGRRYDVDGDGRIARSEYPRGEVRFANYDRNGDGVLEAADFPSDTHFNGFSHYLVEQADADEDGELTKEEWTSFRDSFDGNGDGRVTRAEAAEVLGPWTDDWRLFLLSFDQDGDGDFDRADLDVTFSDQDYNGDGVLVGKEMEGWARTRERDEGDPPAVGDPAPTFELPYADDPMRAYRLPEGGAGRPVALIFGSYT